MGGNGYGNLGKTKGLWALKCIASNTLALVTLGLVIPSRTLTNYSFSLLFLTADGVLE